jgi:hypothetical protein
MSSPRDDSETTPMSAAEDIWLGFYFKLFGKNYLLASLALSAFFFLIGLGISLKIDFLTSYINSLPIYLGVFGISWVAAWIYTVSVRLHVIFRDVRHVLLMSDQDFNEFRLLWIGRFFNMRLHVYGSIIVIIISWSYLVFLAFYFNDIPWFPVEWSKEPYLWGKVLILAIYAIPINFLVFTAAAGIVTYCFFTVSVSKKPLVPLFEFARQKLRSIADVSVLAGFAWSVGVATFVLLFRPAFGLLSVGIVFVLTGLGLLMLAAPQYALHLALEHTKRAVLDAVYQKWVGGFEATTATNFDAMTSKLLSSEGMHLHDTVHTIIDAHTWPYNPRHVMSVLGTWVIPFLALAVGQKIP